MPAKRYVVVVNPRGGTRQGLKVLERVKPVFAAAGAELDVHMTQHAGHANQLAQLLNLNDYDGFCVVGGDGTTHEVVDGMLRRADGTSLALGLIPAGTGNTLHAQINCADPLVAANKVLAGQTRPLDVARVTMESETVYCANIIGWGAIADINGRAEKMRALGPPRYALSALWQVMRTRRRHAKIILDDQVIEDEFLFALACNTRSTGSGMILAPHAEIDDGKIDVVVVRATSRLEQLKLFAKVFNGSHLSLSCVEYRQVRFLAITSDVREPLDLDGEIKGSTPFSAEMMPGALRVFA